jgi:hypothetical protein
MGRRRWSDFTEMFDSLPGSRRTKATIVLMAATAAGIVACGMWVFRIVAMPGRSFRGIPPPLSAEERNLQNLLARHVGYLADTVGQRNLERDSALGAAAAYIRDNLQEYGYVIAEQPYKVSGVIPVSNFEAVLRGTDLVDENVIIGAHYDSAVGTPGADDNATGTAAVLELARLLREAKLRRTVRFVLFVNEEPPYFQTDEMGSLVYAQKLRREGTKVSAMISLEMLGYYSDKKGTQQYPPLFGWLYPDEGNFIAFVGDQDSRKLVRKAVQLFRSSTQFPSEGVAAPGDLEGVGWSDHWSFWQKGYPAIMITDTALFRNRYYHTQRDTPQKLDYERMARVVMGVSRVVESLANEGQN